MSRRDLHNDENFWPCVSDMFLALFVIALVLYSTMSADKAKGDEYISDLAAQEACELFVKLQEKYPDSEPLKSINVDEIKDEEHGARPKLAKALYSLLSCKESAPFFHETAKIPDDTAMYRYSDAIALLYEARKPGGGFPPDASDPCYHVHMRKVREHVELEIYKSESDSKYPRPSREELLAKIEELKERILKMVPKEEYDKLSSKAQKLKSLIDKENKLDCEIHDLKRQLTDLQKDIDKQTKKIKDQEGTISELEDTRKQVMNKVKALLEKEYPKLLNAGVEVKEEEGIVIIPSSVFAFPKATTDYYQQGVGVSAENLDGRLKNHLNDEQKKTLELLAEFLDEIAGMVAKNDLAVDNISIECHTDNDVRKIKDIKYYNDGLSLQRAFDVWRLLDMYQAGRLSEYEHADGQRLFSMSGFGMRVLPRERDNESRVNYETRCRRMQLRFNCKPKKKSDSSSSPQKKTAAY